MEIKKAKNNTKEKLAKILARTKDLLENEEYSALYPNHKCTESLIRITRQFLDKQKPLNSSKKVTPTNPQMYSSITISDPMNNCMTFSE